MSQSDNKNFLHKQFLITVEEPQVFTVRCYNGTVVSTTKYSVQGTKIISLPVTCSLSSKVMICSSIDVIGGGDVRIPMKPGFAAVLNLTHATIENLQLEKTEWRQAMVEPYKDPF